MASLLYNRALLNTFTGGINWDTGTFRVMLVTSAYTPNVDVDNDRADVTNEVTGTGYTAGGNLVDVTVTLNTANDRLDIVLPGTTWPTSTITARAAVYYLSTGVAANDLLIAYNDFNSNVSSTAATFTLNQSTVTITNNSAA